MNQSFNEISSVIKNRRTTKAAAMNGSKIPDKQIASLLELADWAPTHGRTEPWKFFIYKNDALKKFGADHAELYKQNTTAEDFNSDKYEKLLHAVDKASHLIIAVMKRGANPKIGQLEEICAASAAVQNILLGASALGIAAIWNSGGMTHNDSMKKYLGLADEDIVLGLLYLGYSDQPTKEGKRNIPLEEKVKWL